MARFKNDKMRMNNKPSVQSFKRWLVCGFAVLSFLGGAVPAKAVVPTEDRSIAVLRALDKITARVEEIEVPLEQPFKFGTLILTVHACRTTPPEETPESAVFLDVTEMKTDRQETPVFQGWMFASSPALSAMEHPLYDIWLIGCKTGASN